MQIIALILSLMMLIQSSAWSIGHVYMLVFLFRTSELRLQLPLNSAERRHHQTSDFCECSF